ncbi:type ii secretion system integral membrane subunit [Rhodococcus sp. Eu-32]|uniref:type II secretion system F family protein n=1 Tax=Rhodococcus sp. Eu-32 TaxID=1017319 RepID=UPI000DF17A5C|nr:type II secretion system F family protein [Rhodococcus sp. Eu-32]RRQ27944.1 type ii secretion system integral membrane subunit [Rhodococcus sp. Eu-32]
MSALAFAVCAAAVVVLPGPRRRVLFPRRPAEVAKAGGISRTVAVGSGAVALLVSTYLVGGVSAVCATAVVASTLVVRRRRALRDRVRRAEIDSLAAGLDVVIGELSVGSHPALACAAAADEGSGDAAVAFGRAAGRARLGGHAHAGLAVTDSVLTKELSRLSIVWRVADEYGLGLAGLLAAARSDISARRRFRDRVTSGLAGARATATVLACLPVVGVLLGQMMGAEPLGVLLGGGLGGVLLVVGSALVCAGLLWSDAITGRVVR